MYLYHMGAWLQSLLSLFLFIEKKAVNAYNNLAQ